MLRKEQRCYAEKRSTESVSKGSSDGTLYSMAVPGFSLHSEEQNDSTLQWESIVKAQFLNLIPPHQ